jgi:hypothetical protein
MDALEASKRPCISTRRGFQFGLGGLLLLVAAFAACFAAIRSFGVAGVAICVVLGITVLVLKARPLVTGPVLLILSTLYAAPYVLTSPFGEYGGLIGCGEISIVSHHWWSPLYGSLRTPFTRFVYRVYQPLDCLDSLYVHKPYAYVSYPPGATLPPMELARRPSATEGVFLVVLGSWLVLGAVGVLWSLLPRRGLPT